MKQRKPTCLKEPAALAIIACKWFPHYQTEGWVAEGSGHALQVIADAYMLPFLLQQGHIHVQMFAVCAGCDLHSKVQAVLLIELFSAFLLQF